MAKKQKRKRKPVPPRVVLTDAEAYQQLLKLGYTRMRIAKILGISKQAITRWQEIPLKHVKKLSEATGFAKADLRPSDFA
jgi:DNA invertase Pin-like site-specific DNA recombinase